MNSESITLNLCVFVKLAGNMSNHVRSGSCSIHTYTVYVYIHILSLAIVFRDVLKTLYILYTYDMYT